MRVRETKLCDYGFTPDEERQLRQFCRRLDSVDEMLLLECTMKVNVDISKDLYYSITSGVSYDKLENIKHIMISRTDFYGYQRKTLDTFRKELIERGRYPF
ncbi:MAG: hypothetical protein J1E64_04910 [Acetatifactor sp.]|nr:hypothetical protein [Acetatifactor sp.]